MTFKKAAGVVVISRGVAILSRRILKYKGESVPFGGYWSPFAGLIEQGETPEEAAVRELREESNIEIAAEDLIFLKELKSKERSFMLYAIDLEEFPKKIKLCEEHTDMGYFFIEHLKDLPTDYKIDEEIMNCLEEYNLKIK